MPPTDSTKRTPRKATPSLSAPIDPPAMPMPPEDKYAPTAWSAEALDDGPQDFTVPSGQTCLVRRPGVERLLREGVLFESDTLTTLVHENLELVEKGKPPVEVSMEELMSDPDKFEELMSTTDRIVAACVLKPSIERALNDPTNRKPGVIYTDMIALEDKFAILEFALGGSRGLAPFLAGSSEGVGGVPARQSTRRPAKRAAARKR